MPPIMAHHSLLFFGPLLVLVVAHSDLAHSDLAFMTAKCCQDWCSYHMYTSLFPVHVHIVKACNWIVFRNMSPSMLGYLVYWNGMEWWVVACGKSVEAGTG